MIVVEILLNEVDIIAKFGCLNTVGRIMEQGFNCKNYLWNVIIWNKIMFMNLNCYLMKSLE